MIGQHPKQQQGFSLVEVMLTLPILALIVYIAMNSSLLFFNANKYLKYLNLTRQFKREMIEQLKDPANCLSLFNSRGAHAYLNGNNPLRDLRIPALLQDLTYAKKLQYISSTMYGYKRGTYVSSPYWLTPRIGNMGDPYGRIVRGTYSIIVDDKTGGGGRSDQTLDIPLVIYTDNTGNITSCTSDLVNQFYQMEMCQHLGGVIVDNQGCKVPRYVYGTYNIKSLNPNAIDAYLNVLWKDQINNFSLIKIGDAADHVR